MDQLYGTLSGGEQLDGVLTIPKTVGELGEKTITENGTYDASDDGYDGYSRVVASVPNTYTAGDEGKVVDNGALVSQTSATYTINNTYDTTLINSVTVNVSGGSTPTLETVTKTYTPTTSQQTETITPSSGYDGIGEVDVTVNAMPTGTEGTPTATKGAVSNHAVQVTPSVTNQAGYIAGGTKTGTAVTVSASELVSGTKQITQNGTGIDVTNYASVDVNVSGGGGSVLPSGYTQLDFIMASGTQYIELNYTPVQNDHISTQFNKTGGSDTALFSAGVGTYQWLMLGNYYRYFSSGSASSFSPSISTGRVYELEVDSTATAKSAGLTTSTATKAYGGAIDGTNTHLNLCRRANNSSFYIGYVYEFIVSNNGTEKVHLVPCIQDSTEKAGMYDILSNTFYLSAGSSDFIAGPKSLNDTQALNLLLGGA